MEKGWGTVTGEPKQVPHVFPASPWGREPVTWPSGPRARSGAGVCTSVCPASSNGLPTVRRPGTPARHPHPQARRRASSQGSSSRKPSGTACLPARDGDTTEGGGETTPLPAPCPLFPPQPSFPFGWLPCHTGDPTAGHGHPHGHQRPVTRVGPLASAPKPRCQA